MKKLVQSVSAIALSVAMVSSIMPVYAEGEDVITKDESVYAFLDAEGNVDDITVSEWLHNDKGFNKYEDTSILKDVMNLKSEETIQSYKDGYVWTSSNTDLYYQGSCSKELPISMKVEYELDGKTISAKDIVGKDGHVKMHVQLTNNEKEMMNIDGVERPIYTPFLSVAMVIFNGTDVTNIDSSLGTTQTDASNKAVMAVMLPGLKESFGNLLDSNLTGLKSYMNDDLYIEADVENFATPTIMMAVSTNNKDLKETISKKNMDKAAKDLDQIEMSTGKLIGGVEALKNGAVALNNGSKDLKNGTNELYAGTKQLNDGLGLLVSKNGQLVNGMDQLANGMMEQVNAMLPEGFGPLTWDNYTQVLEGAAGISEEVKNGARANLKDMIYQKTGKMVSDSDVDQLIYLALTKHPDIFEDSNPAKVKQNIANAFEEEGKVVQGAMATKMKLEECGRDIIANGGAEKVPAVKLLLGNTDKKYTLVYDHLEPTVYEKIASENPSLSKEEISKQAKTVTNMILAEASLNYNEYMTFEQNLAKAAKDLEKAKVEKKVMDTYINDAKDLKENANYQAIIKSTMMQMQTQNPVEAHTAIISKIQSAASMYGAYLSNDEACLALAIACKEPLTNGFENNVSVALKQLKDAKDLETSMKKVQQVAVLGTKSEEIKTLLSHFSYYDNVIEEMVKAGVPEDKAPAILVLTAKQYSPKLSFEENVAKTSKELQDALAVSMDAKKAYTSEGKKIVNGFLDSLVNSATHAEFQKVLVSLNGVAALKEGLHQYTNGVKTAYDGSCKLLEGSKQLNDGAGKLYNGSTQLKNGTIELYNGLGNLAENGFKGGNLESIAKILEETSKRRNAYNNYAGISENTEGKVKFVYKVDQMKPKNMKKEKAPVEEEKEELTFWQRVKNLFTKN